MNRFKGRRHVLWPMLIALALRALVLRSEAQIVTLVDQNSVAQVNTASQAGKFNCQINGVNQLFQQWFWYRISPSGPANSIDTINAPNSSTTNSTTLYASI